MLRMHGLYEQCTLALFRPPCSSYYHADSPQVVLLKHSQWCFARVEYIARAVHQVCVLRHRRRIWISKHARVFEPRSSSASDKFISQACLFLLLVVSSQDGFDRWIFPPFVPHRYLPF